MLDDDEDDDLIVDEIPRPDDAADALAVALTASFQL